MEQIKINVNGIDYEIKAKPWATLLEVIRDDLGLTGAKEGCGEGECGACTVIIDGKAVNACIMLAVEANNKTITTIEGLAHGDKLHPIQEAFLEEGGMQCGFCTPGMIISTKVLLDGNKNPTDEEIRKGLEGNFCRCTGYTKIFESVKAAAAKISSPAASAARGGGSDGLAGGGGDVSPKNS